MRGRGEPTRTRLVLAAVLVLVYAAPLLWPPAALPPGSVTRPDAWMLERILPGVPSVWIAIRLVALAAAAMLVSVVPTFPVERAPRVGTVRPHPGTALRLAAIAIAGLHAWWAPQAFELGSAGQMFYLLALLAPATLLAFGSQRAGGARPGRRWRRAGGVFVVVGVWTLLRLWSDPHSPRVADVVDGWLGFLATLHFASDRMNILSDVYDPKLAGVGGVISIFHGTLLARAGLIEQTFVTTQVFQIVVTAASAVGLAALARAIAGRAAAVVAVAVFLFAPYTRFTTLFPGPFVAGPAVAITLALLVLHASRRRSEAALAALGAAAGIGVTYPGLVPTVAFFGLVTVWYLAREWRAVWAGAVAGLGSFAAAVIPLFPNVITPEKILGHLRWEGASALNDAMLIGQISLRAYHPLVPDVTARPFDILVASFLAPFAHPRLAVRLWGDAMFDPIGGALIAVGLAACIRGARHAATGRWLLLFLVAALSPAFVSPFEVVDITHALVVPVPLALLAATGFAAATDWAGWTGRTRRRAAAITTLVACIGGTLLFDVVAPRRLSASSAGILFDVVAPEDLGRVVLVDYASDVIPNAKSLHQEAIAQHAGARSIGYLAYGGGRFPQRDLPAEGRDLLFWSHALDLDYTIADAICRRWPGTTLYELWDRAHLGRTFAARIGDAAWTPRTPAGRWRTWDCAAERRRPRAPPP